LKAVKGIGFSRSQVNRLEKDGKFPKRIRLGENTVAWVEAEIDEYIGKAMAARRPVPHRRVTK